MKKLFSALFFLLCISYYAQQHINCQALKNGSVNHVMTAPANLRSDTADILKYTVSLDVTDFAGSTIKGNTIVRFTPKIASLNYICLDLLAMTVDSIKNNNSSIFFMFQN